MNKVLKYQSKNKKNNSNVNKLNIKVNKNESDENLLTKNLLRVSNSNRYFGQDITNTNAVKLVSTLMPVKTFHQKASSITKNVSKNII